MSNAEKFIQQNAKDCTNKSLKKGEYYLWLTPIEARMAVEIAREEIYEWLANHYRDYMHNPTGKKLEAFFGMDMVTDLKQAMKDE